MGFKDDKIFLMSIEEYLKYKNLIPKFSYWWWLRSPGSNQFLVTFIYYGGLVIDYGISVYNIDGSVRPVIKIDKYPAQKLEIGEIFIIYNHPFVYLGDGLAIAETPIITHRFDSDSNDYETSEIRQFLLDWIKER